LGEKLRVIIQTEDMPDRSELMLFEAARACLVDTVIKPALAKGTHVLCDRFFDSTTAYQGYGRGIPLSDVFALNGMATNGLVPDLTIVLDIDPVLGMARKGKPTDRIEAAGMDFHIRVREAFIEIARMNPDRIARVDASMPLQVVVVEVARLIKERLGWQEQGEKQ
jgi:dTMP kinase